MVRAAELCRVLLLAANQGFVAFDHAALAANRAYLRWLHCLADAVTHEPSRAIGAEPKHPLQLQGAHAFLAGAH